MGDAKYLFNKSHATSYSLNSLITAWLKFYYPVEFYASVLSIQEDIDKCVNYMSVIKEEFGIDTIHPDINLSGEFFTPDPSNNVILFGLNSVKGVGEAALKNILSNQPFNSLEDFLNRCDTKSVNKKVIEALIKAGAMDCFNPNRYELLNQYYEIRKVKNVEMFNPKDYNSSIIIEMEEQTLGIPLTARPWFDKQELDTTVRFECIINKVTEKYDRNGNLMAFVKVVIDQDKTPIEVVLFSSTYSKCVQHIEEGNHVRIQGKKTEKAKVIGNKIDVRVH
jgi:DNA polymerase-3 subunit alpha